MSEPTNILYDNNSGILSILTNEKNTITCHYTPKTVAFNIMKVACGNTTTNLEVLLFLIK